MDIWSLIAVVGSLIAVVEFAPKLYRWITKKSKAEASKDGDDRLTLSDNAKKTLKLMQSDPTEEGIFLVVRTLGPAPPTLVCLNHTEIETEITQRVITELEAKGLVTVSLNSRGDDKITLTSLGWTLNPETGETDKVG